MDLRLVVIKNIIIVHKKNNCYLEKKKQLFFKKVELTISYAIVM